MRAEELSLEYLRRAGLEPDWQTVHIGWLGFPGTWDWETLSLLASDVQQFALDSLPSGDAETDYLLVRFVDAESSDRGLEAEADTLKRFADRSGVSETTARRKWQHALLVLLAAEPMPTWNPADPYRYPYDDRYNFERAIEQARRISPDVPLPDFKDEVTGENVLRLREWLFWQEAAK